MEIIQIANEINKLKKDKNIYKDLQQEDLKENTEQVIKDFKKENNNKLKQEILTLAREKIELIKKDGKVQYFKDLKENNEDYTEDQYLLDLQYLQELEKEPKFNDNHMQEGIFDKFKQKDK